MTDQPSLRIALVTSNGWGLGHLSREIAIGIAIGHRAEVTMFTFSRGLPLATQFGLRGEFCPGQTSPWIRPERWDAYVEGRFEAFLSEVEPNVVLFDGVAPYVGVINALRRHRSVSAGWLRRGMWLRGPNNGQLHKTDAFDFVIEPGDISADADDGPTAALQSIRVPPVSLLDVVPSLSRADAAGALGLDPEKPALLFALGAGQPGDSVDARTVAIRQALRHDDWQVGVVRSPLTDPASDGIEGQTDVEIAGVYPLSRYLAAFDAAISAAGYNSVHELIPARVPTLFIPKSASKTDNQVARASYLADRGLALVASDADIEEVESQVKTLLGGAGMGLSARLAQAPDDEMTGGAAEVAAIVTSSPPTGVRQTGVDDWRQPGLRGFVNRAVPPKSIAFVRRVLGKGPARASGDPVSLQPGDGVTQLLITQDPTDVTRSDVQPVEHILAGASSSYRSARKDLISEFYDLVVRR